MSALQQALGQAREIQGAAATQLNPDLEAYDAELAKTAASKAEQRTLMEQKQAETAAVLATPEPPRPAVPVLERVAPKPVQKEDDPLKTFGQMMPLLIALGVGKGKESGVRALNAATSALNAMEANDDKELERANKDWLDSTKMTLENNRIAGDEYTAIMNDRQSAWTEKMAKIGAIAASYDDKLTMAALNAGNPAAIMDRLKIVNTAAEQLGTVVQRAEENQLRRDTLNADIANNKAIQAIQLGKMEDVSVTDVVGRIMNRLAKGEELTPGEREVYAKYDEWRKKSGQIGLPGMGGGGGAYAADPDAEPAMTPPPAAGPKPAAKPAAAASSPPLSALKEGQVTTFANGQRWTLRGGKAVKVG